MPLVFIAVLIKIMASVVVLFVFWLLVAPIIRGAPYVPTHQKRIQRALELANIKPGQKIADLGAGDGRILIEAAKKGAVAYGFEINPFLVWQARRKIKKAGLEYSAFCYCKSFWRQDLSKYDAIFIFGINYIMKSLANKLEKELKPDAKVISFVFPFPDGHPINQENGIFIYDKESVKI